MVHCRAVPWAHRSDLRRRRSAATLDFIRDLTYGPLLQSLQNFVLSFHIMAQQLSQDDLQSVLKFAVDVAKAAGEIISQGSLDIRTQTNVGEKMNSVDLLTKYDVAVEKMVKDRIEKAYPAFRL